MKRSSSLPAMMRLLLVLAVAPSFVQQHVHATAAAQIPTPFVRFSTLPSLLALLVSDVANSGQFVVQAQDPLVGFDFVGNGTCTDSDDGGSDYETIRFANGDNNANISVVADCKRLCVACACQLFGVFNSEFRGFTYTDDPLKLCDCHFDDGFVFGKECTNLGRNSLESSVETDPNPDGTGEIEGSSISFGGDGSIVCYKTNGDFNPSVCPTVAPNVSSLQWLYYPRIFASY